MSAEDTAPQKEAPPKKAGSKKLLIILGAIGGLTLAEAGVFFYLLKSAGGGPAPAHGAEGAHVIQTDAAAHGDAHGANSNDHGAAKADAHGAKDAGHGADAHAAKGDAHGAKDAKGGHDADGHGSGKETAKAESHGAAKSDGHDAPKADAHGAAKGDSHGGKDAHGAAKDAHGGHAPDVPALAIVEVQLLKTFRVPNNKSGRTFIYDIDLIALVPGGRKDEAEAFVKARGGQIADLVTRMMRAAEPRVLNEDDFRTLRSQLQAGLAELAGDDQLFRRVLIPRCMPIRAD